MKAFRQILALLLTFALLFGICGVAEDTELLPAQLEETLEPIEEEQIAAPAEEAPIEEIPAEEEIVEEEPIEEEVVAEEAPLEELVEEEPEADIEAVEESYEAEQPAAEPCPDGEHVIECVYVDESEHAYRCSICGYVESMGGHTVYCTDPTKCAMCGEKVTVEPGEIYHRTEDVKEYTYVDEQNHSWTCPDCGEVRESGHYVPCSQEQPYTCVECHHVLEDPDLDHNYTTEDYKSDADYHWAICEDCGKEVARNEHWSSPENPGFCAVCGAPYTGTNHEHEWEWKSDDTMHWLVCGICGEVDEESRSEHYGTCKNPDVCKECGSSGTMAYSGHDWGDVIGSDADQHWFRCIYCGTFDYVTHWTTCDDPTGLCVDCGKPAVRIEHMDIDPNTYQHDERTHWNICNACGKKVNEAFHWVRCNDLKKSKTASCRTCGAEVTRGTTEEFCGEYKAKKKDSKNHTLICGWCGSKKLERHSVSCTSKTPKVCEICGAKKCSPAKYHPDNCLTPASTDKQCGYYCTKCKKNVYMTNHRVTCASNGHCLYCGKSLPDATVYHTYLGGKCVDCGSEITVQYPKTLTLTVKETRTPKPSTPDDGFFTFKSSDKTVVTVDKNKGKITAKGVGEADITVTGKSSKQKAVCHVIVKPSATELKLGQNITTADIGVDFFQLTASVEPANTIQDVTWKASNGNASVSSKGILLPLKPGKVTITATTKAVNSKGKKLTKKFDLLVVDPKLPTKVTIEQASPQTIYIGGEGIQLSAVVEPKLTASQEVTWSIPAKQQKYATIDAKTGVVTPGKKSGTVTVTVATKDKKVNGKKAKATIKIKVEPAQ